MQVDDKYMYSIEDKDNLVHGWISRNPPTGFWMITPSDEFRVAGPFKQDLTSHAGPITLSVSSRLTHFHFHPSPVSNNTFTLMSTTQMFVSTHYAGTDVGMKFAEGEPWKKVFGPVFVYLNSASPKEDYRSLWQDAKQQVPPNSLFLSISLLMLNLE